MPCSTTSGVETFNTEPSLLYTVALEKEHSEQWASVLELSGYKNTDTENRAYALSKELSRKLNENLELRGQVGFECTNERDNWFVDMGITYEFER